MSTPGHFHGLAQSTELEGDIGEKFPVTSRVAELFQVLGYQGQVIIQDVGTEAGFERFCNGEADIVNAGRPMTDDEMVSCQEAGYAAVPFQGGTDALIIVVS